MNQNNLKHSTEEATEFFYKLECIGEQAQKAYQNILHTFDNALVSQDFSALLDLIPYIEEQEGNLAFQCIGKTHRLLRILHIIELENKFQQPLFIEGCSNTEAIMKKYMSVLFSLQRLSFCISEESVNEAISHLQTQSLSYFAIHTLIETEKIVTNEFFYELILYVFQTLWTEEEKNNFLILNSSKH